MKIRIDYLSEPTANNIYKVQNYDNKLLDVGLRINWRKIKTNVSGRQLISQRLEKLPQNKEHKDPSMYSSGAVPSISISSITEYIVRRKYSIWKMRCY